MGCKGSKIKRISINQSDADDVIVVPVSANGDTPDQTSLAASSSGPSSLGVRPSSSSSHASSGSDSEKSLIRSIIEWSRNIKKTRKRRDTGLVVRQIHRANVDEHHAAGDGDQIEITSIGSQSSQ